MELCWTVKWVATVTNLRLGSKEEKEVDRICWTVNLINSCSSFDIMILNCWSDGPNAFSVALVLIGPGNIDQVLVFFFFFFFFFFPAMFAFWNTNFLIMIVGSTEMPDAMEMIFQSALALGRNGAASYLFSLKFLALTSYRAFPCLILSTTLNWTNWR